MLVDDLKLKGLDLSLDGADLIFATDEELSNDQVNFLKKNKQVLVLELMSTQHVEVIEGDYFPLHRFKGEHLPKPIVTDLPWLHEQLIEVNDRLGVAADYSRIYKQAFQDEPTEHKKEGTARLTANKWLLNKNSDGLSRQVSNSRQKLSCSQYQHKPEVITVN